MIYVASPYSHSDPDVMQQRYEQVKNWVAKRISQTGKPLFSPIAYCHELTQIHQLPTDAKFWHEFNLAFIKPAKEMYILCLDGWAESLGVKSEIDLAREFNIPVTFITL